MVILKEEDKGNDNYSSDDDDSSEEATSNQQQILTVKMVVKRRGRLENKLECEDEDEDEVEIMMIGTEMDKESLEHNLYKDDITPIICHNFSLTSNPPIKPKDSVNFRMKIVKPLTVHTPPSPHVAYFHQNGGNYSSGTKKYRGSNSGDGGDAGDGVKITGGVITFGGGIGKYCAKIIKKQSKPGKVEHEIAKITQKPDQRTFSIQVNKPKAKMQAQGPILPNLQSYIQRN
nr:hypothetical protein [Tanacetum cinerariifolium]